MLIFFLTYIHTGLIYKKEVKEEKKYIIGVFVFYFILYRREKKR